MGNHTASKESQCSSLERSYNSMLFMDWLQRWGKHGFSKITHRKIVTKAKFSHVCFPRGCRLYNVVFQLLSHIWLFATPWTPAQKASLSFTISLSLLKRMSIELMMTLVGMKRPGHWTGKTSLSGQWGTIEAPQLFFLTIFRAAHPQFTFHSHPQVPLIKQKRNLIIITWIQIHSAHLAILTGFVPFFFFLPDGGCAASEKDD